MTGDPIRTATRVAHHMRRIADQTPPEALRFLLEEAGELAKAVRRDDPRNVAEEVADCVIVLDHIADRYGLPSLAELVGYKVEADRIRLGCVG
jgi:NTP pyrophosphatase (non-canonical NTP hydrolase)